jgi:hypothetical protein
MAIGFSRRKFLQGASTVAAGLSAIPAFSSKSRAAAQRKTLGKSVLNMNYATGVFLNIAKGFGSFAKHSLAVSNFNNDGYPVGILANSYGGNVNLLPNYFDHYITKWKGMAGFQLSVQLPTIVYSGGKGVFGISPFNRGTYSGAPTFLNNANQSVEWAFGTLITGISTDLATGFLKFNTPASTSAFLKSGLRCKLNNIVGLGAGPNSDGSWTIQTGDSKGNFLVQGTSTISPSSLTLQKAGGPGVQSEVIIDITSLNPQVAVIFPNSIPGRGTIKYAFSDFVWCKATDLVDLDAGYEVSRTIIDSIKALNPRYLRFMDWQAAQASYSDINFVQPATALIYDQSVSHNNLVGASPTNTGDAYSCGNPANSVSKGWTGAYQDGEIVQLVAPAANSAGQPTLNVGGRGPAPIYPGDNPNGAQPSSSPLSQNYIVIGGTITNADVVSLTFTASYLPGGAHTITYTINTGANGPTGVRDTSLLNLMNNVAAQAQADLVMCAAGFQFYLSADAKGVGFSYPPARGALAIAGSASPAGTETFTYQYVNPGTIVSGNFFTFIYNVALGGWIKIGSDSNGTYFAGYPLAVFSEICNRSGCGAWFCLSLLSTTASAQAFGQWAQNNMPGLPIVVEFSNELWNGFEQPRNMAGALAFCYGWSSANDHDSSFSIQPTYCYQALKTAQLLPKFAAGYTGAGGSRSNLVLMLGNWALSGLDHSPDNGSMVPYKWNGTQVATQPASFQGTISGNVLTVTSCMGTIRPGLTLAGAGVTAGTRIAYPSPAGSTNTGNGTYFLDTSQTVSTQLPMSASNQVYSAVGGLDGASTTTSYNAFPTRPIDLCDAIAYAVYYFGAQVGDGQGGAGSAANATRFLAANGISAYNNIFTAGQDWNSGSLTAALNLLDADIRSGLLNAASPDASTIASFTGNTTDQQIIRKFESDCALYDGARPSGMANLGVCWYESSLQVSMDGAGGATLLSTSPASLAAQFNNNGWNAGLTSTYGIGSTTMATALVNLFLNYVNSSQYNATVLFFWNTAKILHAARPFFSQAQYGVEGPAGGSLLNDAPLWGLYPGDASSAPLQNYGAEQFYNTH